MGNSVCSPSKLYARATCFSSSSFTMFVLLSFTMFVLLFSMTIPGTHKVLSICSGNIDFTRFFDNYFS